MQHSVYIQLSCFVWQAGQIPQPDYQSIKGATHTGTLHFWTVGENMQTWRTFKLFFRLFVCFLMRHARHHAYAWYFFPSFMWVSPSASTLIEWFHSKQEKQHFTWSGVHKNDMTPSWRSCDKMFMTVVLKCYSVSYVIFHAKFTLFEVSFLWQLVMNQNKIACQCFCYFNFSSIFSFISMATKTKTILFNVQNPNNSPMHLVLNRQKAWTELGFGCISLSFSL